MIKTRENNVVKFSILLIMSVESHGDSNEREKKKNSLYDPDYISTVDVYFVFIFFFLIFASN